MLIRDFRNVAKKGIVACVEAANFLQEILNWEKEALGSVEGMSRGERVLAIILPIIGLC